MKEEDFEPGDIIMLKPEQKIVLRKRVPKFGEGFMVATTTCKCEWPLGPCAAEFSESSEEADECCRICSSRASQKVSLGEPIFGTELYRSCTEEYPAAAFTLIRKAGSYQLASKAEI